ncbi:MAG: AMP-binding protein [bacterium]|nr:AMP-binding protein [bacterium]
MGIFDKILKKEKSIWDKYYSKEEKNIKFTDKTIYEYLKTCISLDRYNSIALNYFGKKTTYRQLISKVEQVSKSLLNLGVRRGDVVTICMPNTPEAVECFYAINNIGAISNMIHPLSAPEEIKHYLIESKSRIMIMLDSVYEKVEDIFSETLLYKVIIVSAKDSMPNLLKIGYQITRGYKIKKPSLNNKCYLRWNDFLLSGINCDIKINNDMKKDDVAIILHSGGTTGVPKGILISNYNFNAESQQCKYNVKKVRPNDKILTILPIFHGFGLGVCIHCPLTLGAEVILVPEYDSKRFLSIMKKDKPNVLAGVPTLWESMISNSGFDSVDLSFIKYVISGGDYLTESLEKKANDFLRSHGANISIGKGYGMTESVAATCFTVDGVNKPGSIGIPMAGNDYCICVPNTQDRLPYGEEGEICVSGPTVMMGYLDNEKETNMVLQIHDDNKIWLHTGDMGYISPDGFIYFTQRLKRMIVCSGFNVYPSQIEEVIEKHPKVLKCSVVGIPHPYKMQIPKAFIVLKSGEKVNLKIKKEIKDLCEENLSRFSWPKEYEYRESLPKTLYGKINYRELESESINEKN